MWEYGFDGELYLQGLHYLDVAHRNVAIRLSANSFSTSLFFAVKSYFASDGNKFYASMTIIADMKLFSM